MDIDILKGEIKAANSRIAQDQLCVRQAQQEIADYLCPFDVGDKVISQKGEKAIIASISYRGWDGGYSFRVFKIKKNGEPYKDSQQAYGDMANAVKES